MNVIKIKDGSPALHSVFLGVLKIGVQLNFGGIKMTPIKKQLTTLVFILSSIGFINRNAFSAPAEMPPQPTTVFSQIGLALPVVGDMGDISDTGLFFGAQVMQQVDPNVSYGVGVSYYSFGKASKDQVDTAVSILSTTLMTHHNIVLYGTSLTK
jgi:hypothetical protein